MRLYLAGPMQGLPEFNFPAFNSVAALLRSHGHIVFNPAEKDIERHGGVDISKGNTTGSIDQSVTEHKFSLRDALREDTDFICSRADGIVMLPGWEHSNGALAEWFLARALSKAYKWTFIYVTKDAVGNYSVPMIAKEVANAA